MEVEVEYVILPNLYETNHIYHDRCNFTGGYRWQIMERFHSVGICLQHPSIKVYIVTRSFTINTPSRVVCLY